MAVRFELPPDLEQHLRSAVPDLDQQAKEAALVEMYRQQKLTRHELAISLGLSRLETEALLHRHRVTEDLPTPAEIADDVESLRRLMQR
jgi:hypothetical protein